MSVEVCCAIIRSALCWRKRVTGSTACGEQLASPLHTEPPVGSPGQPGVSGRPRPKHPGLIHRWWGQEAHRRDFASATMWSTPHATSTTWPGTVTWGGKITHKKEVNNNIKWKEVRKEDVQFLCFYCTYSEDRGFIYVLSFVRDPGFHNVQHWQEVWALHNPVKMSSWEDVLIEVCRLKLKISTGHIQVANIL